MKLVWLQVNTRIIIDQMTRASTDRSEVTEQEMHTGQTASTNKIILGHTRIIMS